jgi:hypothetical protein
VAYNPQIRNFAGPAANIGIFNDARGPIFA